MARAALRAGLVDRIGDRTAFGRRMAELAGTDDERRAGQLPRGPLRRLDRRASGEPMRAARSACSPSPATIVDGEAGPGTAGGETIARNLERGLESGNLRALVVRVDSPGGSVLASERIRRAILAAQGARPPGRDLDGLGRGVGRLLDRDRGRHHLRRALDDHRLDRRVRHPAELRGHAAAARRRRRRGAHDAAVGRARSAARPVARGRPAAADRGREHLSPLHRPGRAGAAAAAGAGRRDRARAGSGTAAPRASSAWSTASARSTTRSPRRRGGPGSIPPTRGRSSSSRSPASSPRLFARPGARRATQARRATPSPGWRAGPRR